MAITLYSFPQSLGAGSGGDVTLTFTNAPIQGDLVVITGGHSGAGALGNAGYTVVASQTGAIPRLVMAYKFMTATPDTSVVCSGNGVAADATNYSCLILRGVDLTTPLDTTPTTAAAADGAAITTVTNGAFVVVGAGRTGSATNLGNLTASGYSSTSSITTDTNRMSSGIGSKEIAVAGVENPGVWSSGGLGTEFSITAAFRPATGGAAPNSGFFRLFPK